MSMSPRVLCFSVAMNGYQFLYQKNVVSHRDYCARQGYEYVCVSKPMVTRLGRDSVWLKISLLREALLSGYDWVACLDVDTEVQVDAPAFHLLHQKSKAIYLAEGFSGRFNSGVIFMENTKSALAFIEKLLLSAYQPLDSSDCVGWGENGHLIRLARDHSAVETISSRWNNNREPFLEDYIRHYSRGPLHDLYKPSFIRLAVFKIIHFLVSCIEFDYQEDEKPVDFQKQLEQLTRYMVRRYPEFDLSSVFNRAVNLDLQRFNDFRNPETHSFDAVKDV